MVKALGINNSEWKNSYCKITKVSNTRFTKKSIMSDNEV